uniref:Mpv17-like protein n=1 Tax=Acrobeloides nanus TaxID=290746 RepID=A0A914E7W0_9BILA
MQLVIGTVLIANYKIWPFVQFINMSLMPLHLRLVFVQVVSIFWNMYLSYENAKSNIANSDLTNPDLISK